MKPGSGRQGMERRARGYFEVVKARLANHRLGIVSVAMDATRMVGRETLYSCLWDPLTRGGSWSPPA
eukprot:11220231-Lingulodinium_polyedra.AAC.1